jgi:hypothetical protein
VSPPAALPAYLEDQGIAGRARQQGGAGRPHIVDKIIDGEIAMIFNTTEGLAEPEGQRIDPRVPRVVGKVVLHHGGG